MIIIEKDGFKFIGALFAAGVVFLFLFLPLAIFFFVLALAVALFFRETKRGMTFADQQIVSPASGKVVDIREVFEPEFLKEKTRRVSIFMSLLDEHINYAPVKGEVVFLKHRNGGFKRAYLEEASDCNEAQQIGYRSDQYEILMKQIAGVVARRIVCRCRVGDTLRAGEKMGLIRFGSRVELFLPLGARLRISPGQKVKGGMTIIGDIS